MYDLGFFPSAEQASQSSRLLDPFCHDSERAALVINDVSLFHIFENEVVADIRPDHRHLLALCRLPTYRHFP